MDLLTLGETRREAASGYFVHVLPYGEYLRAEAEGDSGNAFAAALLRAGLRREDGTPYFGPEDDPRELMSTPLFMRCAEAIVALNTASDLSGKSDAAPESGSPSA